MVFNTFSPWCDPYQKEYTGQFLGSYLTAVTSNNSHESLECLSLGSEHFTHLIFNNTRQRIVRKKKRNNKIVFWNKANGSAIYFETLLKYL